MTRSGARAAGDVTDDVVLGVDTHLETSTWRWRWTDWEGAWARSR